MQRRAILIAVLFASTAACSSAHEAATVSVKGEPITSHAATILDFDFAAEVVARSDATPRAAIVSQLMYVQGILMSEKNGNAQIGNVKLSSVRVAHEGDKVRIAYEATLPVAWPKDVAVPSSYELALPLDASSFDAFNAKYDGRCGKSGHGRDAFWYDWNPKASGCSLDGDVSKIRVAVAPSELETTNRYPEYDLVWKDGRLDVVALFGIVDEDTPRDWGYVEAQRFADHARGQLGGVSVEDNGATASIRKDTTVTGKAMIGGRPLDVKLDVLVVQDLANAGADFDARYDPLSEKADLVLYNGHAGLGRTANAFERKGRVAPGKYQIVLVDGCQTFAYLDGTLSERRREANGDADPRGTRFLDVVANAMPNLVSEFAKVSSAIYDAAIDADAPRSYRELLAAVPEDQVAVVFGEEDNRFTPR